MSKAAKPGTIFGDEALELRMIDGYRYARQLEVSMILVGRKMNLADYHNRFQKAEDETTTSQTILTKPLRKPIPKIKTSQPVKSTKPSNISSKPSIRIAKVDIYNGIVANANLYNIVAELQCFADDESIKAIILRVDSPGGTFIASDYPCSGH